MKPHASSQLPLIFYLIARLYFPVRFSQSKHHIKITQKNASKDTIQNPVSFFMEVQDNVQGHLDDCMFRCLQI
jgi:hypothetical protein